VGFRLIHVHITLRTYLPGPPVGMDRGGCPVLVSHRPQIRTVTFSTECTFNFSTENKKWRQITKVLHLMINLTIYLLSFILSLLVFVFWVNLNCSYNNLFKQLLLFFPLSFLPTGFEIALWTTHLQEREINMAVAYVNGLLLQQHCCGA
jgi:hypothetical protein